MMLNIPRETLLKSMTAPQGCIVTLPVPSQVGRAICLAGGEPVDELHVTLLFLESLTDVSLMSRLVEEVISDFDSFPVWTTNIERFTNTQNDVIYLGVDSPVLSQIRNLIADKFDEAGVNYSKKYEWTPHITLAYVDSDVPTPTLSEGVLNTNWVAEFIEIWNNGIRFRYLLANHQTK